MAKVTRNPEKYPWDIEDLKSGHEFTVNVLYYYHPGRPQTRHEPEEHAEIEVVGIEYVAGALNDMHWEMSREMIEHLIMDEESHEHSLIEQAIHEHIQDENERRDESEREYESMVDSAIAQSYDKTH